MSKDYLDKWEERQKQNTKIIEQQQAKTKKMTQEILIFEKKRLFKLIDIYIYTSIIIGYILGLIVGIII